MRWRRNEPAMFCNLPEGGLTLRDRREKQRRQPQQLRQRLPLGPQPLRLRQPLLPLGHLLGREV